MPLKGHGGAKTTSAKSSGGYKMNGLKPQANNKRGKQHISTMAHKKSSMGHPRSK